MLGMLCKWSMNNFFWTSYCIWSMKMYQHMALSCGIGWNIFVCENVIFITSCIDETLVNEIHWLTFKERIALCTQLQEFLVRWIRFIDGTLVEVQIFIYNEVHKTWFDDWKNTYAMNNTIIMDHCGLLIHIDVGYLRSYHDLNILQHSNIYWD